MNDHNRNILEKIRAHANSHNFRARLRCTPLYAVNIVIQGDKLQVCRSRDYFKPNNKRAKRELQNSGGTIEANETPAMAGLRELKEETWNDLPESVKKEYAFPVLLHTQKIYFGEATVIFIHKVPSGHKMYEGDIPQPETTENGGGEIEHIQMVPIKEVYESLGTGYNGVKWRRCSVWSFKRLKYLLDLYTQIQV